MIFALRGKIFDLEITKLFLDVRDIIYEIHISFRSFQALQDKDEVIIYVSEIIREDSHSFFGFFTKLEKQTFDTLIRVNGVGPRVAQTILSTYSAEEFIRIIANKDITALQKVSGIGAKSAGKIMVELSGFYVDLLPRENKEAHKQAKMALESLGYKANMIDKILKKIQKDRVEDIIKEALKLMQ